MTFSRVGVVFGHWCTGRGERIFKGDLGEVIQMGVACNDLHYIWVWVRVHPGVHPGVDCGLQVPYPSISSYSGEG